MKRDGIGVIRLRSPMDEDPQAVLDELNSAESDECLYIDRGKPHDAYLWEDPDDDTYLLLERSTSGTWYQPCPITPDRAVKYLDSVDDTVAVEVRPQTKLPPGRHPDDNI